jgi:hypothetical protein
MINNLKEEIQKLVLDLKKENKQFYPNTKYWHHQKQL